jgi:hypothetical protein
MFHSVSDGAIQMQLIRIENELSTSGLNFPHRQRIIHFADE